METLSSLASTVIGKVLIWIITALVAVIIGMGGWVYILKADVKVAKSKKAQVQVVLDAVVNQLTQNAEDYQRRLGDANKTNTIIQKQYINTVKYIQTWEDHNDTCDEAMRTIDAYQF